MRLTIHRPDLGKAIAETDNDIEHAITSGMRDAADGLKQDLREDVVAAGLGERLSRQFLVKEFGGERPSPKWARAPKPQPRAWPAKVGTGFASGQAAQTQLWSRAPKIVDAFDRSVVIRRNSSTKYWRGLFLGDPDRSRRQERTECHWFARKAHTGRLAKAIRPEASVRLSPRTSFAAGRG